MRQRKNAHCGASWQRKRILIRYSKEPPFRSLLLHLTLTLSHMTAVKTDFWNSGLVPEKSYASRNDISSVSTTLSTSVT